MINTAVSDTFIDVAVVVLKINVMVQLNTKLLITQQSIIITSIYLASKSSANE